MANSSTAIELPERSVTVDEPDKQTKNDLTGAQNALALAHEFVVDCPEMYEAAGTELALVKARYKSLDAKRKELTKPLDDLKKQWMAFFKPSLNALQAAELHYKKIMTVYHTEQEHKRLRAEADAREIARKEREAKEAEARAAEQSGKEELAEAMRIEAEQIHVPIVNVEQPKADGVSYRSTWSAEVDNFMELVKAVAAGHVPQQALTVNQTFINQQARSLQNALNYPGVKAVENKVLSKRI